MDARGHGHQIKQSVGGRGDVVNRGSAVQKINDKVSCCEKTAKLREKGGNSLFFLYILSIMGGGEGVEAFNQVKCCREGRYGQLQLSNAKNMIS